MSKFIPQLTDDGSCTFFSSEFGEAFHSHSGAKQEAEEKFVTTCRLPHKARKGASKLRILDICYGLGYNSAAALEKIWQTNPHCSIELIALENNLDVPQSAIAYKLLHQWQSGVPNLLEKLATTHQVRTSLLHAQLLIGDARQTLQQIHQSGFSADAIFLDPFSPPKCPQLWTVEFLKLAAQCLKFEGVLVTYSCAASVRVALQLAGLKISPTPSVGRRSPGTLASFNPTHLCPLSQQEQEHLSTRAAIPYRDPSLQDSAETIRQRRNQEQQGSSLEPTSRWKKRWSKTNNLKLR